MNFFYKAFESFLLENIKLKRQSDKEILIKDIQTNKVISVDISDFIYSNTDGGRENFTIVGKRANDSKTDPTKKAGDIMTINGRLSFNYKPTGGESPTGDKMERYKNYNIITVLVNSVDGKKYPKKVLRNFRVDSVNKLIMNNKTYNIL